MTQSASKPKLRKFWSKRFVICWVIWALVLELAHIGFAFQAAFDPGISFAELKIDIVEMYEIPLIGYLPMVVFAFALAHVTHRRLERRKTVRALNSNKCTHCDYSRDGLPDSSECPECGETN